MNLANAYLLHGDRDASLQCLQKASEMVDDHTNWEPRVIFHAENACISLALGYVETAFSHIALLEQTIGQRVGPPNWGVCERLSIMRSFHVNGPEAAAERARSALARFEGRNLLYYLDVMAGMAFLERSRTGELQLETKKALELLESLGLHGKKQLLKNQGFLF
jgi:hypothetical protein